MAVIQDEVSRLHWNVEQWNGIVEWWHDWLS